MQLGGIGEEHGTDVHHVTRCLHDHRHAAEGKTGAALHTSEVSSQNMRAQQGESEMSITGWIQKLFRDTWKRMLGVWHGSEAAQADIRGENGSGPGVAQQAYNISDTSVINEKGAYNQERLMQQNPYFTAVSENTPALGRLSLGQRIKMKCRGVAGRLADHLPGRFAGNFKFLKNGGFHSGRDRKREDLSRRSKYREDMLEIDCVLTDDSYLLDSYDRKGEYSQLTTKK